MRNKILLSSLFLIISLLWIISTVMALSWTADVNGGWIATDGGYTLRMWNTTGTTTWTAPEGIADISLLVVAGGGGGGAHHAGGGGAGGVITTNLASVSGTKTVVVGAGGLGNLDLYYPGANGGSSSFDDKVAVGGGGGGSRFNAAGGNGGSGGGAGYSGSFGTGTAGQGNNGGQDYAAGAYPGGGGGGAGQVGGSAAGAYLGGNGGSGILSSISGVSTYYGGGGGGGVYVGGTPGSGGLGGGGAGGANGYNGANGINTTGGGGGGGGGNGNAGGNGGSGIVIIKYTSKPIITLSWISPTNSTYIAQNKFWNFSLNLSCSGSDCGFVNVTLDPWEIDELMDGKTLQLDNNGKTIGVIENEKKSAELPNKQQIYESVIVKNEKNWFEKFINFLKEALINEK